MFVHLGVLLALVGAKPACRGTGVEHSPDHLLVRPGSAGRDPAGDVANVGAIQVQSDTLGERFHVVFSEAGVCAGRAALRAGVTFLDATDESVVDLSANLRMRTDHFSHVHPELLFQWLPTFLMTARWIGSSHRGWF
jgi:hypothetical protein